MTRYGMLIANITDSPGIWVFFVVDMLILTLVIVSIFDMNRYELRKVIIHSDKIPEGKEVRFVFLSDLHSKEFANHNEELLQTIRDCNPDFILIGGDMMTARPGKNNDVAVSLVNRLSKEYTLYYALGNHEYRARIYPETYRDMYPEYRKAIENEHVMILDNASAELKDVPVRISGLTIDRYYYQRFKKHEMPGDYLKDCIGANPADRFHIVLAHNPDYGEEYFTYGADLVLSGHLHGGIVRLPFVGGVASPAFRLFPKYNGGLYTKDGKNLYVSCGLGTHTLPVRFLNPCEVTLISIRNSK